MKLLGRSWEIRPLPARQAGLLGGLAYLAALAALVARAGASVPSDPASPPSQAVGVVQVLAPVDHVEILDMVSFPPQDELIVVSGLPNSCMTFDGYSLEKAGNVIRIEMFNLKPVGPIICFAVYETVETRIPLGRDFEPNVAYTVEVNGVTKSFVAWDAAKAAPPMSEELRSPKERAAPAATDAEITALIQANTAFAFDLYQNLRGGRREPVLFPLQHFGRSGHDLRRSQGRDATPDGGHVPLPAVPGGPSPSLQHVGPGTRLPPTRCEGKDGEGFRLNVVNAIWSPNSTFWRRTMEPV